MRLAQIRFEQWALFNHPMSKHLFKDILDKLPFDSRIAGFETDKNDPNITRFLIQSGQFKDIHFNDYPPEIIVMMKRDNVTDPPYIDSVDWTAAMDPAMQPVPCSVQSSGPAIVPNIGQNDIVTTQPKNQVDSSNTSTCVHEEAYYTGLTKIVKYCKKCGIDL